MTGFCHRTVRVYSRNWIHQPIVCMATVRERQGQHLSMQSKRIFPYHNRAPIWEYIVCSVYLPKPDDNNT